MRAWIIDSFSGIDKMRLTEVADPKPNRGEVLLRMDYAALNPADRYLAQGEYPAKPPMPHILGRDGSGTIVEVGPDVENHPDPVGVNGLCSRPDVVETQWFPHRSCPYVSPTLDSAKDCKRFSLS